MNPREQDPLWYKDAVIYELHVKAFCDSNADGIGDFAGLMQKLDYLQDLGVTALWLLPFYPSPLKDDGYDIADYRNIHPSYGTMKDFKAFVRAAHARGMAVISELVINHTSDQHPWFQAARSAPKGSARRSYYVWSDTDKKYQGVRIIFTDTEVSNWTWDSVAQQYYWHRFFSHQPDLNFDNPVVRRKVIEIMNYWLGMGVDGLRLDAIPYLVERDGTNCENLPETHACIKEIRAAVDAAFSNRMLLAEANQWPPDVRPYFGDSDECHMAFHFPVMPRMYMALRQEDRRPIVDIMQQTPAIPEDCQWAIFLRNHDELTLEMVTDEERDYMYNAYAADRQMRINVGIRRRLAPLLNNSRRRMELMNSLLLSFPGTPVLYYGDEIGMGDNVYLGDRNGVRTPMQWSPDRNAGFSRADPARLYHPIIMDPVYGYQSINVEAQERDPSSLLNWMRRMIALRKSHKVFGRGSIEFLRPRNRKVLAYVRKDESETLLCIANLSRFVQPVELDLREYEGLVPVEMIGHTEFPAIGELPYFITLAPHGFYWFQLQRSTAPTVVWPPRRVPEPEALEAAPVLDAPGGWRDLVEGPARERLEKEILGPFIQRQRWSGAHARGVEQVAIDDWGLLRDGEPTLLLLLATARFRDGGSATYVLPFALSPTGASFAETNAVVARLDGPGGGSVLYDAMVDERAARHLLALFDERAAVAMQRGEIKPSLMPAWRDLRGHANRALSVSLGGVEQSNSSVRYGRRLFLKLYRRVEPGANPDVELPQYLSTQAGFRHVPRTAATLQYEPAGITLALMSAQVPNQGDGWEHALEELGRYYETIAAAHRHDQAPVEKRGLLDLSAAQPPDLAADLIGAYLQAASTLGQRTGEMHLALSRATADSMRPEPLAPEDLKALSASLKVDVAQALDTLGERLGSIPESALGMAERVMAGRQALQKRSPRARASAGQRIRIHGDYHLGQVLWSGWDFIILDFEGEPARPASERRLRQSPLRDVAGMVRSFAYAANAGLFDFTRDRPDDRAMLQPWADFWYQWSAAAFVAGYRGALGGSDAIPKDSAAFEELLGWFVLQKAVYELLYELNHRPDWVGIPLQGLVALL